MNWNTIGPFLSAARQAPCGEGWDEANKKHIPIHLSSVETRMEEGMKAMLKRVF